MNSKQRRKKRRAANQTPKQPTGFTLVTVFGKGGLLDFSENNGIGLSKIVCGYSAAPLYINQVSDTELELFHECVLEEGHYCRYKSPKDTFIDDHCTIYDKNF